MRSKSGLKLPPPCIANRRRFMKALGFGAFGLGTGMAFRPSSALEPRKNRVLLWLTDHGTVPESWRMNLGFSGSGAEVASLGSLSESEWSPILSPLAPYAAKLNIVEGIGRAPELDYERRGGEGDRHTFGQTMVLTCVDAITESDIMGGGPSIDQVIGNFASTPGGLGARVYGRNHYKGYSFTDRGRPTPLIGDPQSAFEDLMGLYVPPSDGEPQEPSAPSRDQLIREARASVLDFAAAEYDFVASRLGNEDRLKLEEHRALIRDLEVNFARNDGSMPGNNPAAACDPSVYDDGGADLDLFGRIAALSFSCDMARVALILGRLPSGSFDMPAGADFHQDIAHGADSDPEAARVMTDFNTAYSRHFASLLGYLDSISDGDGTLLDNTVTTWLTELATGPHELDAVPYVVAGSGAGFLRTGQYVHYEPTHSVEGGWDEYRLGGSNAQLYVTLMQSMGMTDDTFGMTDVQGMSIQGPLAELLA